MFSNYGAGGNYSELPIGIYLDRKKNTEIIDIIKPKNKL